MPEDRTVFGKEIKSDEGTTQGDAISMGMYVSTNVSTHDNRYIH